MADAPDDLLDRQPPHEIQAADLRALLHPEHNLLLASITTVERGSRPPPEDAKAPPGGSAFNRRQGVSATEPSSRIAPSPSIDLTYEIQQTRRRLKARSTGRRAIGQPAAGVTLSAETGFPGRTR